MANGDGRTALVLLFVLGCDRKPTPSPTPEPVPVSPVVSSAPPLEKSCAAICAKNVACAGLSAEEAGPKQADCENVCRSQGSGDPLASEILPQAMARVASRCGAVDCAVFGDCYMDALKDMQEELLGVPAEPTKALSTEQRERLVTLVCEVVAESPGKIPDLNDPHPSPKMRELKDMMGKLVDGQGSVSEIADAMKEAMATCAAR